VDDGGYRFGYQGQESDDEISGIAKTHYNYTFRMHDARIGRFWSVDPLRRKYPGWSPYAFSQNRVIDGIELEGLEYLNKSKVEAETYKAPSKRVTGIDSDGNFVTSTVGGSAAGTNITANDDGTYNFTYLGQEYTNVSTVDYDGGTYFNIGEHIIDPGGNKHTEWVYTDIQNFDQNTMHTYTWGDDELTGNDAFGGEANENCASLAQAQAMEVGTNLQGGVVSPDYAINTYNAETAIQLNTAASIDYINQQLEAGNAVVIGVHYGTGATDQLGTDHYITITGRTSVHGVGRFLFMENAVSNSANARDFSSNRLTPGREGITGSSPHWYNTQYRVTRVQRNQ
jgi:RHS repeat-associated protein